MESRGELGFASLFWLMLFGLAFCLSHMIAACNPVYMLTWSWINDYELETDAQYHCMQLVVDCYALVLGYARHSALHLQCLRVMNAGFQLLIAP